MRWWRGFLTVAATLLAGAAHAAHAPASDWVRTDQTEVRLVAAASAVGRAETVRLGLLFRLKPGWKIYWRSPGAAGYPPRLDWTGSENLADAYISWPAPERFSVLGFNTLGYREEVVLPITARLAEVGEAVRLRAVLDYLTCDEVCIPYSTSLALDLPAGPAGPTEFTHLIDRYVARVPGSGEGQGLAIERAAATDTADGTVLEVVARSTRPFAGPDLFVEGPELLEFGAPAVELREAGRQAILRLPVNAVAGPVEGLVDSRITLTLADGDRAMEQAVTVLAGVGGNAALRALMGMLGLALVGGLILNLMPCVLPALSIKLLGVISHGGAERRQVRLGFLASSAGIVFSFLVLGGALVGAKAAGAEIGWGIQFQQPAFLVAMVLILTLFACNLWGLFEFRLPRAAADLAGRPGEAQGLGGHFLMGVFVTILATPCSTPFLGTAVGFALSRGAFEIFAIFAALGTGLALPYLVVSALPELATRLPRPGPWMVKLKWVLGFLLAATVLWLLTVLAVQVAAPAAYAVGGLMAAVTAVLWLRRRLPGRARLARPAALAMLAVLAFLAFLAPAWLPDGGPEFPEPARDAVWQPFDRQAIPELVRRGKTVFVDVTAEWCITCQANKVLVLDRHPVAGRLADSGVVAMRADWTRPNDAITAYLASFGRYGVPFNAVYGPGAPHGVALPELLTAGVVLDALAAAGGTATARR